jgi:hypothetical protein
MGAAGHSPRASSLHHLLLLVAMLVEVLLCGFQRDNYLQVTSQTRLLFGDSAMGMQNGGRELDVLCNRGCCRAFDKGIYVNIWNTWLTNSWVIESYAQ